MENYSNRPTGWYSELTPLLDVVFILVIFLILSANNKYLYSFTINLATVKEQQTSVEVNYLVVYMDHNSVLFTAANQQSEGESISDFLARVVPSDQTRIELVADRTLPYQNITQVLEAAYRMKLGSINLIVAQEKLTRTS